MAQIAKVVDLVFLCAESDQNIGETVIEILLNSNIDSIESLNFSNNN